jgi:hypothetical protein
MSQKVLSKLPHSNLKIRTLELRGSEIMKFSITDPKRGVVGGDGDSVEFSLVLSVGELVVDDPSKWLRVRVETPGTGSATQGVQQGLWPITADIVTSAVQPAEKVSCRGHISIVFWPMLSTSTVPYRRHAHTGMRTHHTPTTSNGFVCFSSLVSKTAQ